MAECNGMKHIDVLERDDFGPPKCKRSSKKLSYSVHKCSSHSASYIAENILVNQPNDQSSRWTSESNWPPQFVILKLEHVSLVDSITFGKYEKTHVCNLKKFQVYGGLSEDKMVLLLNSGLRNDPEAEEFSIKYQVEGYPVPSQFIKIVPILTFGTSYNFSIWYVELKGTDDAEKVQPCLQHYNEYREREVVRMCLKHFRQHNYTFAFNALQERTNVDLEHPLLSELHERLVQEGDYAACERIMERVGREGLFNDYISQQEYFPEWRLILPPASGDEEKPGMRGGHQMCMDAEAEMIYLLGGWDGSQDLGDFWSYNIATNQWTCISKNTADEGGPTPRSCFKLCIDSNRKQIYTLGRYMDASMRKTTPLKSDFYVFDIGTISWTLICEDTAAYGGPRLIFDHQMCMDPIRSMIYVFGGRMLTSSSDTLPEERRQEGSYSGLYSYHIPTNTWTLLRPDVGASDGRKALKSRIGHSMLFHPMERKLYIFGGQRGRDHLSDFFSYDVDQDEVEVILDGTKKDDLNVPAVGVTQRATIDPDLNEIHVLSGLSRGKDKKDDTVKNAFWVYYVNRKKWSCVYKNENNDQSYWKKQQNFEPCPRYAHQLVYDYILKRHYLFGGNPGNRDRMKDRLDDFWSLHLIRPTQEQLLRKCLYLLRRHKFLEMATTDPIQALSYLQNEMALTVDHSNPQETLEFQQLASSLFSPAVDVPIHLMTVKIEDENPHYTLRTQLFDTLVNYFPENMTQPKNNLLDFLL